MTQKQPTVWTVGAVAARTGLTVRTLHYYDDIGLVSPARGGKSGHRLYNAADIERLRRIQALRGLGLSLREIREGLDRPEYASPHRVLALHRVRVEEHIALEEALCGQLETLAARLGASEDIPVEDVIRAIRLTNQLEPYRTPRRTVSMPESDRD